MRRPEGLTHLTLNLPCFFLYFVLFVFLVLEGLGSGEVAQRPTALNHLIINLPFFFVCFVFFLLFCFCVCVCVQNMFPILPFVLVFCCCCFLSLQVGIFCVLSFFHRRFASLDLVLLFVHVAVLVNFDFGGFVLSKQERKHKNPGTRKPKKGNINPENMFSFSAIVLTNSVSKLFWAAENAFFAETTIQIVVTSKKIEKMTHNGQIVYVNIWSKCMLLSDPIMLLDIAGPDNNLRMGSF